MKVIAISLLVVGALGASRALAEKTGYGPDAVEWGKVGWLRDYDMAATAAKASGKPILLMFQEVPG